MLLVRPDRCTEMRILIVLSSDIIARHSFQGGGASHQIVTIFYQPSHSDIQKVINFKMGAWL